MIIDKLNLLDQLNDVAKPIFGNFLNRIQTELFLDIRINCVYDSYADSLKLHELDSRNPLYNFHEFGLAVDMNIIKDFGIVGKERTFLKKDTSEDWDLTGVPQLAKECGVRWGGDFSTYHDPVHWDIASKFGTDVYDVLNKMIALAKKQFGEDLSTCRLNKTDLSSLPFVD
jgi:hypothetical protein